MNPLEKFWEKRRNNLTDLKLLMYDIKGTDYNTPFIEDTFEILVRTFSLWTLKYTSNLQREVSG